MSVVSNWIVVRVRDSYPAPLHRLDDSGVLVLFQEALLKTSTRYSGEPVMFDATEARGKTDQGPKALEMGIWVGAGNYFSVERMLEVLAGHPDIAQELQIFHCGEDDACFREVWYPRVSRKV
jgi:hypothetical protein